MKTPCEIIVWNIVPVIKKELAISLVNDIGLSQKNTSLKLGTTEAAISRYISGKRGVLEITDDEILEEIKKSAEKISKNNGTTVINEICRICKILKSKEIVEGINYECE
jgi:predicted transcriptional regulator